ncbi:serine hydrolase domain-containing protein [Mycolicibacterium smegmatis]|uniref:serine hydrolase domain-containing protein n=1 Tax=Mycolicibacterium smegmatis TaxID=1772 RepID=UPI00048CA58A|nr:serine hydrolase domain-containing protein [Mycolicibacterium smegmatis]AIU11769.1 beta-lactamase [Mycolicibacterium smegmatis MC2 155]AIU18394.1 beta-lactamase [Mycolicibacterium smegmatis]AIU25016.1 beta-lactamase [Mycolicibacterium smegmatis]MCC3335688.1 beta-lactamase family protein [Mycolicibacterium smegmatis]MCO4191603.1 beta-lactamase family protein [Mycolicibacterium smegmatis]
MRLSRSRVPRLCAIGAVFAVVAATSCSRPAPAPREPAPATGIAAASPAPTAPPTQVTQPVTPTGDFSAVTRLVDDAVAARRLPGAVVQIGHAGKIVFRAAFGARKLDGEPGLDGSPSPAEPMTEDTLFDLASLTKSIATTTAVLQLYEQGKIRLDEPVQTYLPDFNPTGDPRRARVTLRMLLTHTSGIAGDLSLDGPWGLTAADKAEGVKRALAAWVVFEPGAMFHYSDIGFIILGTLVEKITGQSLDGYVREHVFAPLGMSDTYYLPAANACGPHEIRGNALVSDPDGPRTTDCPADSWSTGLLTRVAPTALDEDTPGINPHFGLPLRGTVHDPTARRMGGVAGSAGVFTTVHDLGLFAQALLDRRANRPSTFPLQQATVELMTTPQQPGAGPDLRGLGWDIDTPHSRPRGTVFPVGSFGHTGFTGVSMWMDPGSDTYVIVLANVIHQRGGPPIATLSGDVATEAARALHLYGT